MFWSQVRGASVGRLVGGNTACATFVKEARRHVSNVRLSTGVGWRRGRGEYMVRRLGWHDVDRRVGGVAASEPSRLRYYSLFFG